MHNGTITVGIRWKGSEIECPIFTFQGRLLTIYGSTHVQRAIPEEIGFIWIVGNTLEAGWAPFIRDGSPFSSSAEKKKRAHQAASSESSSVMSTSKPIAIGGSSKSGVKGGGTSMMSRLVGVEGARRERAGCCGGRDSGRKDHGSWRDMGEMKMGELMLLYP